MLRVSFITDASWKSAVPKKGMVVCSWLMYTSTELGKTPPSVTPMPSGMPSNMIPSTVSPTVMIAFTDEPLGTPGSSVM